jgi:5-methylcytosine-specific restriction protein A
MPTRVCAQPGCPTLVAKGYCPAHAREKRVVHQRFQTGGGLYGRPWRRARAAYLNEHPWCAGYNVPAGHEALATELDHRIPHRGDRALFWDTTNWQGLCEDCHGRKTADETLHATGAA